VIGWPVLIVAFQRFEHESAYHRADQFHQPGDGHARRSAGPACQRQPAQFEDFLRSLVLYDPDSQLYLLAPDGTVLARSGKAPLPPGYRVAMEPVRQAAEASALGDSRRAAYVMGDDPEYMEHNTVVAARALRRAQIGPGEAVAGYLYLVCRKPGLPGPRLALFGSSLAGPALASVLAVCLLMAGLAAWIIVAVTRPLRVLSDEVAGCRAHRASPRRPAECRPPARKPMTNLAACATAFTPCWPRWAGSGMNCAGWMRFAAKASATSRTTCAAR
jgi:hypothetical protein